MGSAETTTEGGDAGRELLSLKGELLLLVAEQARRVPPTVMAAAAVIAVLVSRDMGLTFPLLWFAAVAVGTYFHSTMVVALPRDRRFSEDRKLTRAAISFTVHGAIMASALLAFPYVTVTIQAVLTIYCVGLASATLPATAGFARIFRPYTVVTLTPICIAWSLPLHPDVGTLERVAMVALTFAYLVTMWGHAKGSFQLFCDSHRMRQERLALNRQLRDALTQAESASVAKTRFLASASHDLRQPIHALTLFSGSLSMRPLDARTAAIAEQIDKAVTVLGSQLDALLDISRLDAGVIEKNLSVIDLRLMLEQLLQEFRPQAEKKGLSLSLHCANGVMVRSDAGLLLRVLRNLISNAVKYTQSGEVEMSAGTEGGRCRVVIRDTGPGIPEGEQDHVFEEFYQLDNPERDRSKGLGLGLAIVRRLTALLEVDLRLESRVGEGSQFTLQLALATAAEAPPPMLPAMHPSPSNQLRVLVVDDEEAIRLGMKILLEEMGFEVQLATSTHTAAQVAETFLPAIVLADFRLHGDDNGMRVIEALRLRWPNLPALLISGDTAPDRLQKAHAAGIVLLHKPVAAAALKTAILEAAFSEAA